MWAVLNDDHRAALGEIVRSDSDRIVAIVGGAMLDDALRLTMEHRLRADKDMNNKLFRVNGPLGNLGPKIDLAYQLYMLDKPLRNAMYGISEVRNLFAHNLSMQFDTSNKQMTDAFAKMKLHDGREFYPTPYNFDSTDKIESMNNRRDQFVVNLKLCLMWLMGDFTRHIPNWNIPLHGALST